MPYGPDGAVGDSPGKRGSMTFQYVIAQTSDVPVIFAQAKELVDTYEDLSSIDYDKVMAWMERKIAANISQYRCVLANGKKCAFWRLCEDGELDDLYVLPEFRSIGIGAKIMEKCIQESENPLWLYVFRNNTRAISFYERFGFTVREAVGSTRLIMSRNS